MHLTAFVVYLIFGAVSATHAIDYCAKELCPYQGTHIRCNNTGSFSSACKGKYMVANLTSQVELILSEHNYYRNMIASGDLPCFKPATRMPELQWDEVMAETATFNVKTCIFAHDKCRSTPEFPYAGQNIYYTKTKRKNITIEGVIKEAIFLWFDEQKDCNYTILESFDSTEPQTGHFTMIVNDRNTLVGCAMLIAALPNESEDTQTLMIIFTCNYTSTNIRLKPSYQAGPTGADCKNPSKDYKALCSDRINVNDLNRYYKAP